MKSRKATFPLFGYMTHLSGNNKQGRLRRYLEKLVDNFPKDKACAAFPCYGWPNRYSHCSKSVSFVGTQGNKTIPDLLGALSGGKSVFFSHSLQLLASLVLRLDCFNLYFHGCIASSSAACLSVYNSPPVLLKSHR